jgi:hypothetical protein
VRGFVTRHRVGLSLFSTFNLALIVWQVLSGAQSICEWRLPAPACPCLPLPAPACPCLPACCLSDASTNVTVRLSCVLCHAALTLPLTALQCNAGVDVLPTRTAVMDQPFVGLVYVFLLSAGQHLVYLAFNFTVST